MAMNHAGMIERDRVDEGVIHSVDRPFETRLVRVTGCDLDPVRRCRYDPTGNRVQLLEPRFG